MLNKRIVLVVWIVWIVWIALIIILLSIIPLLYFFHIVTNDKVLTVIGFIIWLILVGLGTPFSYKTYLEERQRLSGRKEEDKDK